VGLVGAGPPAGCVGWAANAAGCVRRGERLTSGVLFIGTVELVATVARLLAPGWQALRDDASMWTDSHCHLDAPEFDADRGAVVQRARSAGVGHMVLPAVAASNWATVRALAHQHGLAYALGIHPLCVGGAVPDDLQRLQVQLAQHRDDPRLVAVGEAGVDCFVQHPPLPLQEQFYVAQLKLARDAGLPVLLHVRRSADLLLKALRRVDVPGGIVHAFNGSDVQAQQLVDRGFKLGFGGAMTFDRALQIRHLAATLPEHALVLETDAPDIPPHWLYRTAQQRQQPGGSPQQGRNEPAEVPRIAQHLATLRGWSLAHTAAVTTANVCAALPRLALLMHAPAPAPAPTIVRA
jgi:TatD DNase family protein